MGESTCLEQGCKGKSAARGLCRRHYQIRHRHGTLPPLQLQLMLGVHSLTNVDKNQRLADCAVCGPGIRIRVRVRAGRGGIECMTKIASAPRRRKRKRISRSRRGVPYVLSRADYEAIYESQGGRCAICQQQPDTLMIDHDHSDGRVRGLLCHHCNVALGFLRDSPDLADEAAAYLRS
jgi:hypothetical protein